MSESFVYFLRAANGTGPIKIGYSINPVGRLASYMNWSPVELKIVGVFPGTRKCENRIHKHLAASHLRGEWFTATTAVKTLLAALHCNAIKISQLPFNPPKRKRCEWLGRTQRLNHALNKSGFVPTSITLRQWWLQNSVEARRFSRTAELAELIEQFVGDPKSYGVAGHVVSTYHRRSIEPVQ